MQANIFLLLSVIFVSTSTGHGYVPRTIPHQDFHPLEIAAVSPSFSSTNGSTHDEIMQELGTRYGAIYCTIYGHVPIHMQ